MSEVTFRPATAQDKDRMAEIVNAEPGQEPIALMGDVDLARASRWSLRKVTRSSECCSTSSAISESRTRALKCCGCS